MTKAQLKTFVNEQLLDGRTMNDTHFDTQLRIAKNNVLSKRPWAVLRAEDASNTIPASNTWEDTHALPTDFYKPYWTKRTDGIKSPLLLRTGEHIRHFMEIPWATRIERKDTPSLFAVDHVNRVFIVTGDIERSYTAYLSYIKKFEDKGGSGNNGSNVWPEFLEEFHEYLGYVIAAREKSRDYDEINRANAADYMSTAQTIFNDMIMWDDELQRAMLQV